MFGLRPGVLARYLARLYLSRLLAVLILLVSVLQLLDLMSRAGDIVSVAGNSNADLLTYILLRTPQLIDRFLPFTLMLASMFTLAELGQRSEIVAMQSAGIGATRIMLPVIMIGLGAAVCHYTFREAVVIPSSAALAAWEDAGFQRHAAESEQSHANVWRYSPALITKVTLATQSGGVIDLRDITLYRRNAAGRITSQTKIAGLRRENGQWTKLVDNGTGTPWEEPIKSGDVPPNLAAPETFFADEPLPNHLDNAALWTMARDGPTADGIERRAEAETVMLHRIAAAASSIVLPILGVIVGFGTLRRGSVLARLALAIALGFTFFVIDNLMVSIGKLGSLPAPIAVSVPLLLIIVGSVYTLIWVETPT